MKVVRKDNFNRDLYVEIAVAENVTQHWGKELVDSWNEKNHTETSPHYLSLEEDDYELKDSYKELMGE